MIIQGPALSKACSSEEPAPVHVPAMAPAPPVKQPVILPIPPVMPPAAEPPIPTIGPLVVVASQAHVSFPSYNFLRISLE